MEVELNVNMVRNKFLKPSTAEMRIMSKTTIFLHSCRESEDPNICYREDIGVPIIKASNINTTEGGSCSALPPFSPTVYFE